MRDAAWKRTDVRAISPFTPHMYVEPTGRPYGWARAASAPARAATSTALLALAARLPPASARPGACLVSARRIVAITCREDQSKSGVARQSRGSSASALPHSEGSRPKAVLARASAAPRTSPSPVVSQSSAAAQSRAPSAKLAFVDWYSPVEKAERSAASDGWVRSHAHPRQAASRHARAKAGSACAKARALPAAAATRAAVAEVEGGAKKRTHVSSSGATWRSWKCGSVSLW
mmetsp:Transcript_14999/g.45928  ORF Transcript_14999/g.45928 Transcript_14999/m.45928 type:complete len:233 (-) Transcript_14999:903-1601(-)